MKEAVLCQKAAKKKETWSPKYRRYFDVNILTPTFVLFWLHHDCPSRKGQRSTSSSMVIAPQIFRPCHSFLESHFLLVDSTLPYYWLMSRNFLLGKKKKSHTSDFLYWTHEVSKWPILNHVLLQRGKAACPAAQTTLDQ